MSALTIPSFPPSLSLPVHIHHASHILTDLNLAHQITTLVNTGYRSMSPSTLLRWHTPDADRLKSSNHIHDILGDKGFFAVIYNPSEPKQLIACAAAVNWEGDLEGGKREDRNGDGGERGWEIKTITTSMEWQRRGLAGRCVGAICDEVIGQARRASEACAGGGREDEKVRVWIQAVDDQTGVFWSNLGWVEVRSYEKPIGHWGSKFGYRLLVMLREFDVGPESDEK